MQAQVLDSMDLERERGITIKAQSVALDYQARDGQTYRLNMIDTPGHVDFSYEVSRSLTACEGALLVVDASQGVQAQTVANCYTASELNLEIMPVLNKIDLPAAEPERVIRRDRGHHRHPRRRTRCAPAPRPVSASPISWRRSSSASRRRRAMPRRRCKALIIDSWFDNYLGTVSLVRVMEGRLRPKDKIRLMATGRDYLVEQIGIFTPKKQAGGGAGRGRSRLRHRRHQGSAQRPRRRHDYPRQQTGGRGVARLQGNQTAGIRRSLSGGSARLRGVPRRARQTPAERCLAATTNPNPRRRSASVSAAVSSACCTWKSSRSGSNANTISISSPPPRP